MNPCLAMHGTKVWDEQSVMHGWRSAKVSGTWGILPAALSDQVEEPHKPHIQLTPLRSSDTLSTISSTMSSPFNPLAALTPAFPTPGALPALAGLSPAPLHPFLQSPSGQAGTLTSPFAAGTPWLSHLGLPGSVPSLPSLPAGGGLSGGSGMGLGAQQQQSQGGLQGAGTANGATADADDALRAMPEISRLVERAEAVRAEMALLEKNMFGKKGEGAERQGGGLSRLEGGVRRYLSTSR